MYKSLLDVFVALLDDPSVIDVRQLDRLLDLCVPLFEKLRIELPHCDDETRQVYRRIFEGFAIPSQQTPGISGVDPEDTVYAERAERKRARTKAIRAAAAMDAPDDTIMKTPVRTHIHCKLIVKRSYFTPHPQYTVCKMQTTGT